MSLIVCLNWDDIQIGGTNEDDGGNYIYSSQNYGESPVLASIFSASLVVAVPLGHLALVYLKNFVLQKWIKSEYSRTESGEFAIHVESPSK